MMTEEALEFLQKQNVAAADKSVKTDGQGHTFLIGGNVEEFVPDDMPEPIRVSSLSSIVDFIAGSSDARDAKELIVKIVSPTEVSLQGTLDAHGRRRTFMRAQPVMDRFDFETWYDREEMNIALQSRFVPNDDQKALLKFIGNYKESTEQSATDDGVTQVASVRTGAASVNNVKVPNPVALMPYRTFTEVDQPESEFIFRMHEGMRSALFEADGGAWRNEAIKRIKDYFISKIAGMDSELKDSEMKIVVLG